jgi:tagatose 6-phosphate kinase
MTILCVTLNAAIDKRYDLGELRPGQVQRVTQVSASAGGKGINAARAARILGAEVVATGFVGGFAGSFICSEVRALGIRDEFVRIAGESRTCINIIDHAGRSTELLEPGLSVNSGDLAGFTETFAGLLADVSAVSISGSAPSGCPDDVYAGLVQAAHDAGRPVVLDTSGRALAAALDARPSVVKPNRDELAAWLGSPLTSDVALVEAARRLLRSGPRAVLVSLGSRGVLAVTGQRAELFDAPAVTAQNPVGCGDVLVGTLTVGLAEGRDIFAALPAAVRAASAAAAHPRTAVFDPAFAERLPITATHIEENDMDQPHPTRRSGGSSPRPEGHLR